ncbi:MAG: hypothetical protein H8E38_01070 [SAR324 cluster bacterium]|nr:hypothetical protein [SAR324 cluster bacterium]MBL7035790.1 hypothetical protein [SAR324 cluster bacterium]
MKTLLPTVIFCLLIFNWTEPNLSYANESAEFPSVLELKHQSWEVLEKQSEVESRPGLKPYQNLKREIQVVKYRLRKGTEFIFCLVEYDSQLDTIREACDVSQEKAEKRFAQ